MKIYINMMEIKKKEQTDRQTDDRQTNRQTNREEKENQHK